MMTPKIRLIVLSLIIFMVAGTMLWWFSRPYPGGSRYFFPALILEIPRHDQKIGVEVDASYRATQGKESYDLHMPPRFVFDDDKTTVIIGKNLKKEYVRQFSSEGGIELVVKLKIALENDDEHQSKYESIYNESFTVLGKLIQEVEGPQAPVVYKINWKDKK